MTSRFLLRVMRWPSSDKLRETSDGRSLGRGAHAAACVDLESRPGRLAVVDPSLPTAPLCDSVRCAWVAAVSTDWFFGHLGFSL